MSQVCIKMRLRSGALYEGYCSLKEKILPVVVKHINISPLLQLSIARENTYDIDEPIPEDTRQPEDYLQATVPSTTGLDDIDILPELGETSALVDSPAEVSSRKNQGKKRRKKAKKVLEGANTHARNAATAHAGPSVDVDPGIQTKDFQAKKGGYSAKTKRYRYRDKLYSLEELLEMGFRPVEWDGIHPRPIVIDGVIVAVLLGRPDDDSYVVDCANAFEFINEIGDTTKFSKKQKTHKRGAFSAVNVGLVAGQGQTYPMQLNTGPLKPFVDKLLGNASIRRIMGFQSHAISVWAPRLYAYGAKVVKTVCDRLGVRLNFTNSIFPCVAFNFGLQVWTWLHQDVMNLAFFWCVITALGNFNPKNGGHIILWDLKLVVEFPHAASIAIPSATITHSNIPVGEDERRTSITQFLPGGISRWVDNGCMTEKELMIADRKEYDAMQARKAGRWAWGLSLWSTVDEILE